MDSEPDLPKWMATQGNVIAFSFSQDFLTKSYSQE
nr:MAG TPA: hypothetical protein [Caudoviricetes sp.]